MLGALALPVLSATTASAAPTAASALPTSDCYDHPYLPYAVHAKAVVIRSRASSKSTALGVLYKGHAFTVSKRSGTWVYITDRTTGVKGWVSGTYVYRDVRMCLD
ncbi:SH3 domain-containing protein [Streptomyces sp. SID8366]|nr:SH3 domain-containing protein [Streptomyces sp. SID8366]MYU61695.1 SH3 domain-containing protein [Streptomyces sp. SID69]